MTRPGSTDNGPHFITELVRDLAHLRQQQEGIEEKLLRTNGEALQIKHRLDAVERTLRAIGVRQTDLVRKEELQEAAARSRSGLIGTATRLGSPVVIAAATWIAVQLAFAVQHARLDELINGPPGAEPRPTIPRNRR